MSNPISKGKEAKYLLDHPLLNEVLDSIDEEAIAGIRTCMASDLLEYRARLDGVAWFKRALRAHFDNAVIAGRTAEEQP